MSKKAQFNNASRALTPTLLSGAAHALYASFEDARTRDPIARIVAAFHKLYSHYPVVFSHKTTLYEIDATTISDDEDDFVKIVAQLHRDCAERFLEESMVPNWKYIDLFQTITGWKVHIMEELRVSKTIIVESPYGQLHFCVVPNATPPSTNSHATTEVLFSPSIGEGYGGTRTYTACVNSPAPLKHILSGISEMIMTNTILVETHLSVGTLDLGGPDGCESLSIIAHPGDALGCWVIVVLTDSLVFESLANRKQVIAYNGG